MINCVECVSENYKQVNAMIALAKETSDTISKLNNG